MNLYRRLYGEVNLILGIKKDEFEIKREEVITEDINMKTKEIVSLDNGQIFGNEEEFGEIWPQEEETRKEKVKGKNKTVKF